MKVKIKRFNKKIPFPEKATELAAGHDVVASEIIQKEVDFVICKLGFALTPPPGYKVVLVPRSSLTNTHWVLQNTPGQGDEDFTGEYQLRFRAIPIGLTYDSKDEYVLKYTNFPYKEGDRVGQIFVEKVEKFEFEEVEELLVTKRGDGGYGSTGV